MKSYIYSALSRFSPKWMTLNKFAPEFLELARARDITPKTLGSIERYTRTICQEIGEMPMCMVKPVHISRIVRAVWSAGHESAARSVLLVARAIFTEALHSGVIDINPAKAVPPTPLHVKRSRIPLELWLKMLEIAERKAQPWVPHMLRLAIVSAARRGDLRKMRFDDVWDNLLHIETEKTGIRIALPLDLRLDAVNLRLGDVIEGCAKYGSSGATLLRRDFDGKALDKTSLSGRFRDTLLRACGGKWEGKGNPPSLHECRSLAERLYRQQGINTQILLGHKRQTMTDQYNDARGLDAHQWKVLQI
ncbi:MAG: tyrosine-type recombinase/integrase [Zoogloeaceae bacterium]|nr:tyrosine-type recombinase/integrase [Zoogloeaceae bacterium]